MKKIIIPAVVSVLIMGSCSQDEIMNLQQDFPIEFRMVINRQTKANGYTASSLSGFNVTAWKEGSNRNTGAPHVNQVDYTRDTDGAYKSANKYYWPVAGSVDFYAYAPTATSSNGLTRTSELSYGVTPLSDTDSQIDFVFAKNRGKKDSNGASGLSLNFRHAMSQIRINVKNSNSKLQFNVTGWKICGVDGEATFTFDDAIGNTNTMAGNSQNTFDVSMWSDNDDYTANYSKTISNRSVTNANSTWGELDGSAILIPQTAPMATFYTNGNPNGAYIAIQYEALNAGTDDEIVPADTWGCWPVIFEWKPGFRYNYIIDLAEFGYKESGTGELDPVEGDGTNIKFVNVEVDEWQPEDGADIDVPLNKASKIYTPYLRFHTDDGTQSMAMMDMMGNQTETNLEYSLDSTTWSELLFGTPIEFGDDGTGNVDLYLRGKGFCNSLDLNTGSPNKGAAIVFSENDHLVDCFGSVGALTDYDNPTAPLIEVGQYMGLFYGCKALRTAPDLPATELTIGCYNNMFAECENLLTAPELPATVLLMACYSDMFYECYALTTAPELPATTLAEGCYSGMFYNCSDLTTPPELPATVLADYCYDYMFNGCTSLTTAPVLPATTLAEGCYSGMFYNCSDLTTPPSLPATVLADYCYENMFESCTSLTTAPELPATVLADYCYDYMFESCTSLTTAPVLPATTLAESCYSGMFYYCESLASAPVLPATSLIDNCYDYMFQGCSSLNYVKAMFIADPYDISAGSCTGWLDGVATTGTFVRNPLAVWDETDTRIVPDGWNVQNAND